MKREQRLDQHEPAVELEAPVPGQVAAREVARRVRQHRRDQDPVERGRAVEEVVLERLAEASATTTNRRPSASWMVAATRRCSLPRMPRASRSAIVRESSCSTGR